MVVLSVVYNLALRAWTHPSESTAQACSTPGARRRSSAATRHPKFRGSGPRTLFPLCIWAQNLELLETLTFGGRLSARKRAEIASNPHKNTNFWKIGGSMIRGFLTNRCFLRVFSAPERTRQTAQTCCDAHIGTQKKRIMASEGRNFGWRVRRRAPEGNVRGMHVYTCYSQHLLTRKQAQDQARGPCKRSTADNMRRQRRSPVISSPGRKR